MDKERILFIDLGSHYGGVETYIEGLAGTPSGMPPHWNWLAIFHSPYDR